MTVMVMVSCTFCNTTSKSKILFRWGSLVYFRYPKVNVWDALVYVAKCAPGGCTLHLECVNKF